MVRYEIRYRYADFPDDPGLAPTGLLSTKTYRPPRAIEDDLTEVTKAANSLRKVYSHVWIERVEMTRERLDD